MTKADAYRVYLETLTPETLEKLSQFVTPDVRFIDPFNDTTGVNALRHVFEDMFDSVQDIIFNVNALGLDGSVALMSWKFSGTVRGRGFKVDGMSKISFAKDGRVCEHIDHWDSATQFYMRLPIIGTLLSFVRRRISTQGRM